MIISKEARQKSTRKLAELTGTQSQLAILERRYQAQINALKATLDSQKITVSVIQANQGKINVMHSYHSLGGYYAMLVFAFRR
ncbi:iron ABC transporter substrate-binding protein [Escherichia coli]|uniref:Iron ABC transporter substrate-binding protein n=1 Tax=Escherichia coli TaxID=562 RepID=A0A3S4K122_ECOLX|nr:iron ABC transporter substrate-binding protein [Escherichia coli]